MKQRQKPQVDRNDYVPNANVNDNGNANVNDSNVQNDFAARLLAREKVLSHTYSCHERTLFSHPPNMRRASDSFACNLRQLVSFASLSSKMVRIWRANNSASALARIRNCSLTAFGACLAMRSCSRVCLHAFIAGSPTEMRYAFSIV